MSARTFNQAPPKSTTGPARPNLLDYGLLIGLAAIWGAAFMLVEIGVSSIASWSLTTIPLVILVMSAM